jgi:hypothetical protein
MLWMRANFAQPFPAAQSDKSVHLAADESDGQKRSVDRKGDASEVIVASKKFLSENQG